ncbi:MAG: hypothetical protein LUC26_01430 [Prevotella sp.]|nr:hypothetical protein [Prevotella sp.]
MKTFADIGTHLKLALALQCGSLSGSDFDFRCKFFTFMGGLSIGMGKSDMIKQDGAYIAVVDTPFVCIVVSTCRKHVFCLINAAV